MPLLGNLPCVVRAGLNIRALINPGVFDRLKLRGKMPRSLRLKKTIVENYFFIAIASLTRAAIALGSRPYFS